MSKILFYVFEYLGIGLMKVGLHRAASWCFGKSTLYGIRVGILIINPKRYAKGEPMLLWAKEVKND